MNTNTVAAGLLEETGKCLYCGFCEAVCPTLPLGPHRGYGPRGRVTLVAYALEQGVLGPEGVASIYSCLSCGACTMKCPVNISVADLVRGIRSLISSGYIRGETGKAYVTIVSR